MNYTTELDQPFGEACMKIFPPKIEVSDDEGFSAEKDIFNLKPFGERITRLLTNSDDQLVIALEGAWGIGKTTFVKMWAGQLRQNDFPVIYVDAFSNDYIDDPFLVLAGEIAALTQKIKKEKTPAYKRYLAGAAKAGKVILRSGAKIGVKAATLGALDASDFAPLEGVAKDIATETSSKADGYLATILNRQKEQAQNVDEFKKALEDLIPILGKKENPRPLIFIIDELDRCKPPFALSVLETIKHVFALKNMHFVLVTNLSQLETSVRYSYGEKTDARTYLQKFYNLILHLSTDGRYESDKTAKKFLEYLARELPTHQGVIPYVIQAAEALELSLRSIERIITYVALAVATSKKDAFLPPAILAGLCIIKTHNPTLFRKLKTEKVAFKEVRDAIGFSAWKKPPSDFDIWWNAILGERYDRTQHPHIGQQLTGYNFDTFDDALKYVVNSVVDSFDLPSSR